MPDRPRERVLDHLLPTSQLIFPTRPWLPAYGGGYGNRGASRRLHCPTANGDEPNVPRAYCHRDVVLDASWSPDFELCPTCIDYLTRRGLWPL